MSKLSFFVKSKTAKACYVVLTTLLGASGLSASCLSDSASAGCVHFAMRTDSNFNQYITGSLATHQFLEDHLWRMQTTPGWFDKNLSWYPNAWGYIDSLAIYNNSQPLKDQHPEWILRDKNGNKLFIRWGCSGGTCPQYAADISNQAYRDYWINQARSVFNAGYKGIWIDDVNLQLNLSNGFGVFTLPLDRATGQPMTQTAWEQYFADFMTQIRQALPDAELLHNSIWSAGSGSPGSDPIIQQEIRAANWINMERGVDDRGLTGDNGYWSIQSVFRFIDTVHSLGAKINIQNYGFDGDYGPASYFLISSGLDALGNDAITPYNWPSNYDVSLGEPAGARYTWNGLIRRDYANGFVVINPPGAGTVHVQIAGSFVNSDGNSVTQLSLDQRQGAILLGKTTPVTPPPPVPPPPVVIPPVVPPPVQPPPVVIPPVVPPTPTAAFTAGLYTVKNVFSQLMLDNHAQSMKIGTPIVQWAASGGDSQLWSFIHDGAGGWMIQNIHSRMYLEDSNNTAIQDWFGNSLNKHWLIVPANGGYLITNKGTGRALDDSGSSLSQGQAMITWPTTGDANQVWSMQ